MLYDGLDYWFVIIMLDNCGRFIKALDLYDVSFDYLGYSADQHAYASMTVYNDTIWLYAGNDLDRVYVCKISPDLASMSCWTSWNTLLSFSAQSLSIVDNVMIAASDVGAVAFINLTDMRARVIRGLSYSIAVNDAAVIAVANTSSYTSTVCVVDPVTLTSKCINIDNFLVNSMYPLQNKFVVHGFRGVSDVYAVFDTDLNLVRAFMFSIFMPGFFIDMGRYVLVFGVEESSDNTSVIVFNDRFNVVSGYYVNTVPNVIKNYGSNIYSIEYYESQAPQIVSTYNVSIIDVSLEIISSTSSYAEESVSLQQINANTYYLYSDAFNNDVNISLISAIVKLIDVGLGGNAESLSVAPALAVALASVAGAAALLRRAFQ